MKSGKLFRSLLTGTMIAVLVFAFGLSTITAQTAKKLKVAMVTSGPTNDQGWNYDALRGIEELG